MRHGGDKEERLQTFQRRCLRGLGPVVLRDRPGRKSIEARDKRHRDEGRAGDGPLGAFGFFMA